MDHPMLQGAMANVFQAASSWSHAKNRKAKDAASKGRPRKKPKQQDVKQDSSIDFGGMHNAGTALVGWVEVLCSINEKKTRKAKQNNGSINCKQAIRWVHVDPNIQAIDEPNRVEAYLFEQLQYQETDQKPRKMPRGTSKKRHPVAFVMAAEHHSSGDSELQKRLIDVTPRYAFSMVETLKLRGITPKQQAKALSDQKGAWWSKAIKALNASFKGSATGTAKVDGKKPSPCHNKGKSVADAIDMVSDDEKSKEDSEDGGDEDDFEKQELAASVKSEAIPTSKEKFKTHPLYVIPSVLKNAEVLAPDAKKRVQGFFKGEMVFSRSDVSEAIPEKKWLYQGRKVRKSELQKPVKRIKARAMSAKGVGSFKALKSYGVGQENDGSAASQQKQLALASEPLGDGMKDLYAIWQTEKYSLVSDNEGTFSSCQCQPMND